METISFQPGSEVFYFGRKFIIRRVLDLETLLAAELESGELQNIKIKDVSVREPDGSTTASPDIQALPVKDQELIKWRLKIIKPLLGKTRVTTDVIACADRAGVHTATIYRWLDRYETTGLATALLDEKRGARKGKFRLNEELEAIVCGTIEEIYLTKQKSSIRRVCREINIKCKNAGLKPPHDNTIRNRITALSEKQVLKKRHSSKAAGKFEPMPGSFPDADWPLCYVQIDHTPVDIMLVDDIHRRPIGRPWITVAIDVFSRTVPGFYVSLDPPGTLSTGLCIAHAILPKEKWLANLEIQTPWPNWGKMQNLHMDNAKEFRGTMLRMACLEHGINIHWRPVTKPRYGAHIERLLGTFNEDIHELPGTTFSNVREREDYDSEGRAIFTLSEFDAWLTNYIVGIYHQGKHSSLNMSPIEKYKRGIMGDDDGPGIGIPERVVDEDRLRIDFLPIVNRTVQNSGIVVDEIHYYADTLRPWINSTVPETNKKRRFTIRRDPRDISVLYFYDPDICDYFKIPYRNTSYPPISIWELREINTMLKKRGQKNIDERLIFETYEQLDSMVKEAALKTKAARRLAQRKREHNKVVHPETSEAQATADFVPDHDDEDILPFEDLEEIEYDK